MQSLSYNLNQWLSSKWRKGTRFYVLTLCQNIFGAWIITKTWGSAVKHGFGKSQDLECVNYQQGIEIFEKLEQRRLHRGYERVNGLY